MARRAEPERSSRVSVPNVATGAVRWYLAIFTPITAYLTVTNTLFIAAAQQIVGWPGIQYVATGELLKAGGVALITSPVIVEAGRMVIAGIWSERREQKAREEGREEGHEKGKEEGREEGIVKGLGLANQRWAKWNRRRIEAEVKGEPFTEPPPVELENQPELP